MAESLVVAGLQRMDQFVLWLLRRNQSLSWCVGGVTIVLGWPKSLFRALCVMGNPIRPQLANPMFRKQLKYLKTK